MSEPTHITVRGAREHNLRGVDVDLPRDALVVITGVSGSGKSSLAFDTVYKEGQRRFMESLSAYARQFLGQMERPLVDAVEGVSPTLSIDQKTVNRNPRSTVGTVTEIYDHLRLLMARLGTPHCPACREPISRLSTEQVVERLLEDLDGQRILVLGPVVSDRKGEYRKELEALHRDGWVRARVDGEVIRLEEPPKLARYEKHTIEVVVDRLTVDLADRARLAEAVETAVGLGKGVLTVHLPDRETDRDLTFSTERGCPRHPEVAIPELEPRLFSFNAPQGACPTCNGLGNLEDFDVERLVDLSANGHACFRAFNDDGRLPFAHFDRAALKQVLKKLKAPSRPVRDWPPELADKLLWGEPGLTWSVTLDRGNRTEERVRTWRGLVPMVQTVWKYTGYSPLDRFRVRTRCPDCDGQRLNAIARAVTFRDHNIVDLTSLTVADGHALFQGLRLEGSERDIGEQLLVEIRQRLAFLDEVGLGYLTLDRSAATLSGGEAQRIRLAAQVGSALQGVTYVLDEPSIGLHPRDNRRLLGALTRLRDRGNTVLVVEHDAETMLSADYVVDVGPGAGSRGGEIVAAGTPKQLLRSKRSLTAQYLRRERTIPVPESRRQPSGALRIRGARANNLKGVDVALPLGIFTVVTGVSGSGKSSLVNEVLQASVRSLLSGGEPVCCDGVEGAGAVDKLVEISQDPIGRTPRSNPATYTGAFDPIRELFASTPEARARGYKKGRFSFNVAGGRCEACGGAGVKTVEMQFLPSVEVPCEICDGKRFNAETLEITWKGRTIHDVLRMTVEEGADFFAAIPKIARILGTMVDVGLGYVPLGQPSTTLSGGEAQRVKLATELQRPATGRTLYLLDEPTTGLHFEDVSKLLHALQKLVDAGNTVVVVEHDVDLIKCADHLIDMGPEGGDAGGQVVGTGTPEAVSALDSPTGRVLAELPELRDLPIAAEPVTPYRARRRRRSGARELVIRGARMHNLHDVDVVVPHGKMTVVTGVSGSGKTSLAFDTIFAEGQRQYVESLSTYARRFLGRLERAPVDHIEGLEPAIAIDQHASGHNPRSTVATVTEIHDVLRLLYARVGQAHCPRCGREVRGLSPSEAAAHLAEHASGAGWLVTRLRPVTSEVDARRDGLRRDGWTRLLDDGGEVELDDDGALALLAAGATLVLDRLDPRRGGSRVAEAFAAAYQLGEGAAWFHERRGGGVHSYHRLPRCPDHGVVMDTEPTPRHFSFNSQLGACPGCGGLGVARDIVPEKLFPQPDLGFWDALDGRVSAVLRRSARKRALLDAVLGRFGLTVDTPVADWSDEVREVLLYGLDDTVSLSWTKRWGSAVRKVEEEHGWSGVIAIVEGWNSALDWLTAEATCRRCRGGRLRPELLAVTIGGQGIHELCRLTVADARDRVDRWGLSGARAAIAERPLLELRRRLGFLVDVGLGYLSLDRPAETLSGGEAQRIRLASQLGSMLTGVTYVLDEPTIGLHPRDTDRLLGTLEGLRDLGNTVLLVEHDPETIARADHVIDMGPAAGLHGGRVVAVGSPDAIRQDPKSITGRWLSGVERFPSRAERRTPRAWLTVEGARGNNLRDVDVRFPTGVWVGITGVSGSGKSTLVMDTLAPALQAGLGIQVVPAPHRRLVLGEPVDRVVLVDQSPIGRTPRSTPATYTKVLDHLRKLYAGTTGAMERGWAPGRFSFNSPGGRCEMCEGRGATLVEMHFLPDVWVTCEACRGKRFGAETLSVRWQGRSIADVLAMRADEALELFRNHRSIRRPLQALVDVGLGYLTMGQPATTLSGGEAQRVKLAAELTSRRGHCVYVLDEPTTGLHLADVAKLVGVLHRLVDAGHTVITIEHNVDLLRQTDWIVDLGPDGGADGGHIVAEGPPEAIVAAGTATGAALAVVNHQR